LSPDRLSEDFSLCVTDAEKKPIFTIERSGYRKDGGCEEGLKNFEASFDEGTREIRQNNRSYLLSYRRILDGRALITSSVSKDVAFESARVLLFQSISLGLTFLFFSLGFTLIILRAITNRIDELVHFAGEFSEGRFESALKSDKNQDEISRLSHAFEFMRVKIRTLLIETASKARMEKELEAAEWVQKQFFPASPARSTSLTIHHTSFSSSECGGDLWQFRQCGERMYFIFGDITGHGMPAALITAVVYGSFNATLNDLESGMLGASVNEDLLLIAKNLNHTVFSAAKGSTGLSCLIGVIEEKSGVCTIHHYAHPPYLTWSETESKLSVCSARPSSLLGSDFQPAPTMTQTALGDSGKIFFLSDGLFETRELDGKRFNKKNFYRKFEESIKSGVDSSEFLASTEKEAREFFGKNQPDDITAVILEKNGQTSDKLDQTE
jgi:sigma-B regulation protein RsbU (phosphoserine phosphatase)